MRTDLQVPYAEKDEAKSLGARWDAARKLWYVQNVSNLEAFARWLPAGGAAKPASGARGDAGAGGMLKTGARFFELACSCLPWEGCPVCRPVVEARRWAD